MGLRQLKIVICCGNAANQKALANKIAAKYNVTGIVIDTHLAKQKKRKLSQVPATLLDRFRFNKIYAAWNNLMKYYENKFPNWPSVRRLEVPDINNASTEIFIKELKPDLIVVSGTALIKEPLLSMSLPVGIINLHTGLSPYVKGGPNCTNWCIANNSFHLVGNSIMWLNAGIDTGNLIATETIDILQADSLNAAHRMVMDHAHELYLRAIGYLSEAKDSYNSVPQSSIDKGQLYLTKMWTAAKKRALLRNWKKRNSFVTGTLPLTVLLTESKRS